MDENDEQFENYLREFEPRGPRALEPKRQPALDSWRRLAAAAGVMIALGTSLWLVLHSPPWQALQKVRVGTPRPVSVPLFIGSLTKPAAAHTAPLDAGLSAASL